MQIVADNPPKGEAVPHEVDNFYEVTVAGTKSRWRCPETFDGQVSVSPEEQENEFGPAVPGLAEASDHHRTDKWAFSELSAPADGDAVGKKSRVLGQTTPTPYMEVIEDNDELDALILQMQNEETVTEEPVNDVPTIREPAPRENAKGSEDVGTLPTEEVGLLPTERTASAQLSQIPTGTIIADRYRIHGVLGAGRSGIVYLVSHVRLGRRFAMKILSARAFRNQHARDAFFREAKYASSLQHQSVVAVLDFGEAQRYGSYMLMELVRGELLSKVLGDRGPFAVPEACAIALQIAECLAYVHERDIVHSDLRPENVFLLANGSSKSPQRVKLLNVGIAQSQRIRDTDTGLERLSYSSPEATRGEVLTPAADIYSLSALLFALIVGHPPELVVVGSHLDTVAKAAQSLSSTRGQPVESDLKSLLETGLAREPHKRHASMAAFARDLRRVVESMGVGSKPRSKRDTQLDIERLLLIQASYDALRIPLATVSREGVIVAANAAFSQFVLGMRVGVEGSRLESTSLARDWAILTEDLAAACSGQALLREVRVQVPGQTPTYLEMWLEPTTTRGYAVVSIYPKSGEFERGQSQV